MPLKTPKAAYKKPSMAARDGEEVVADERSASGGWYLSVHDKVDEGGERNHLAAVVQRR